MYSHRDLVATIMLEEVKLYSANLLSALAHIHKLGIIHRDIKPGNFLYDRRNRRFALVDFGLAQFEEKISGIKRKMDKDHSDAGGKRKERDKGQEEEPDEDDEDVDDEPCTCLGKMVVCTSCLSLPDIHAPKVGTPGFKPPEVLLKSKSQSVAMDIWAMGVILLSLLSR